MAPNVEAYLYNQMRASDVRDVVLRLLLEQVEKGGGSPGTVEQGV